MGIQVSWVLERVAEHQAAPLGEAIMHPPARPSFVISPLGVMLTICLLLYNIKMLHFLYEVHYATHV